MPHQESITLTKEGHHYVLRAEQWLPAEPEKLWSFLGDCRHMNHVIPDFMRFRILTPMPDGQPPRLAEGVNYDYRLQLHGIGFRWRTLITEVDYPRRFQDEQAKGPYQSFSHEHLFEPTDGGTLTHDVVRYRPPGGPLAGLINAVMVRRDLRQLFVCRHRRLAELYADGGNPADLFNDAAHGSVV